MSRITLLIGAVFLLALALVVVLVTRPGTTSMPHAAPVPPPVAATASPDIADSAPAKDSTDPVITGFVASFRTSSVSACQRSLMATLNSPDPGVANKATVICGCASDRVVASLTVGDVHAATLSAVNGDANSNPTFQALKTKFSDAVKECMLDNQAH